MQYLSRGKVFIGALARTVFQVGKGLGKGIPVVTLSSQVSGAGIGNGADATNDTLFTYSVPLNTLDGNAKSLWVTAWGATAATANNKTIRLVTGATVWLTTGVVTWNALSWWLDAIVSRVDATHVNVMAAIGSSSVAAIQTASLNTVVSDLTANALVLTVTGASPTSSAANDVVSHGMIVQAADV